MSIPGTPLSFPAPQDETAAFTSLIAPIDRELLQALIATLARRFDYAHDEWQECMDTLAPYPEDLVCAAYYRVMRMSPLPCGVLLQSMTDFMSPELQFRIMRHHLIATDRGDV